MARTKRKNIDELPQYSFHDLRLGDTGKAVAFTQWLLKQMGWYNGAIDGVFGQKTLLAVRKFQSAHNVTVSGVVDRPSRYALYGDAVDKGILKAMPTPYYVNNWKLKEQASETSHEVTPGTGTQALNYPTDTTPPEGSVIAPTTPEYSQQLPGEYQSQPLQFLQQPYGAPQQTPGMQHAIPTQQTPGFQQAPGPLPGGFPGGFPAMPMPQVPQGSQPFMGQQQPLQAPTEVQPMQQSMQQPMAYPSYAPSMGQTANLPFGMGDYWNQIYQQQQREFFDFYQPYRYYGFQPYPMPWY